MGRDLLRTSSLLVLSLLMLAPAGCGAIQAAAAGIAGTSVVKPVYPATGSDPGFKGQSVAVMAWADDSLRYEHNMLIMDITRVSQKLQGSQARKAEELWGDVPAQKEAGRDIRVPDEPSGVAADPIVETAPRFGVTRLIYIEVGNFDLHSGAVVDLSRGSLSATVTVVEVATAKGKSPTRPPLMRPTLKRAQKKECLTSPTSRLTSAPSTSFARTSSRSSFRIRVRKTAP